MGVVCGAGGPLASSPNYLVGSVMRNSAAQDFTAFRIGELGAMILSPLFLSRTISR